MHVVCFKCFVHEVNNQVQQNYYDIILFLCRYIHTKAHEIQCLILTLYISALVRAQPYILLKLYIVTYINVLNFQSKYILSYIAINQGDHIMPLLWHSSHSDINNFGWRYYNGRGLFRAGLAAALSQHEKIFTAKHPQQRAVSWLIVTHS